MDKLKEILLKFFNLDSIVEHLNGYVESRIALVKMEVREEVGTVLSRALIILVMFLAGVLFLLFISVGLAEYLNSQLGGEHMGFVVVGGFYGLVLLLMIVFRKKLMKALERQFSEMIRQKGN